MENANGNWYLSKHSFNEEIIMATMLIDILPALDNEAQRIIQAAAMKEVRRNKALRKKYLHAIKDFDSNMQMMACAYENRIRTDVNWPEIERALCEASQGESEQQYAEWML